MINRKQVGILLTTLCASIISITASASCADLLKIANDTLTQNQPLSLEQKTALKACLKDGCQSYSWTLNCAHIGNLVNTPTMPAQSQPTQQSTLNTKTQTINNTNTPTPPAEQGAPSASNTTATTIPTNQTTPNGNKESNTTPTATPTKQTTPNVNWF